MSANIRTAQEHDDCHAAPFRLGPALSANSEGALPLASPKYVALGDREGGVIYQTNGAGGQIVGTTTMRGVGIVSEYFIDGKTVIAPNNATAMFYHYPKGCKPFRTLDATTDLFGAVVSNAVKE